MAFTLSASTGGFAGFTALLTFSALLLGIVANVMEDDANERRRTMTIATWSLLLAAFLIGGGTLANHSIKG